MLTILVRVVLSWLHPPWVVGLTLDLMVVELVCLLEVVLSFAL
jgi:hypothetical protein